MIQYQKIVEFFVCKLLNIRFVSGCFQTCLIRFRLKKLGKNALIALCKFLMILMWRESRWVFEQRLLLMLLVVSQLEGRLNSFFRGEIFAFIWGKERLWNLKRLGLVCRCLEEKEVISLCTFCKGFWLIKQIF